MAYGKPHSAASPLHQKTWKPQWPDRPPSTVCIPVYSQANWTNEVVIVAFIGRLGEHRLYEFQFVQPG